MINKMFGKHRFYCPECNHFMSRRIVQYDMEQDTYYCRVCGSSVIQTEKVLMQRLQDDVELIVKAHKEDMFT